MHVISSDADKATTKIFKAAQRVGSFFGPKQVSFIRALGNGNTRKRIMMFDEIDLDSTTIGNYEPFLTG